ncbi:putative pentatricopeptide repeat-containing protein At3g13770, mitochondrial [Momordica charantia]|uniref:Pentatricopeptide repeat-containing protein At3g13770, mitochondrial n=1 Tax=Momordica charantia TaxID=3673 RepID=A0A6J1DLD3_MOMCH|nr:putative pentatricopeptide repeat-containing protein At3g13770, mitochondrial [Momordica charantia]XP_022154210.1 putative pentatricopeptide repeat-containing protein At3g13770, mitochondrial [Momordica charantia]XP_022154211.1 putative pentatricopeptide repeat-containing protein At3g13770, mitochondrial [Momordica charantia]XP_022154212.1 putative pentatricopeptide repeat-containing protein At3g13770, mitochondrial [Momordica charantia]XP_022154213.1 putative pentatricopeptide repeat-contai
MPWKTSRLYSNGKQIFFSSVSHYSFTRQLSLSSSPNLKTLCSNGEFKEALLQMAILGAEMKFEGYDTILNECVSQRATREGQRVHAHMIKTCYLPPVYLRTRLLVLYNKCGCLGEARKVFDEMPQRNVVSWTAMISAYSQRGFASEALNLFVGMIRSGTEPNEFTFATILTSCIGSLGYEIGRQVHSIAIKRNYESHMFVGSSLLDMYAKSGRIHEAHGVFRYLPERDVVVCTAIISGYAQMGLDEEALGLFRQLQSEGMKSNYVTYASILTALSGLAALNHGKQVHNHVLRLGQSSYVVLLNSLIDMYSKCGNVCYARRIFDSMPERTCISWNAMLVGYSKHGMGNDVLELFKLMREENKVKPDSITFLAVLSGCSHGKLEDRGLEIFYNMADGVDGVEPDIGHYGCVVDLLGRAGRVKEAFDFIKKMPFVPTAAIWGSLLGSCRVHLNVDIGIIVGQQLLEIEPENAGNYVILSNLYASAGRWEDMRNIRDSMQEKAVIKEPGRSWVELDQVVHTFHASDHTHPRREEVAKKVKELSIKFKEDGYVPDLSCVLYDVDDEQKEKVLLGHSEKLALAFGLIATPDRATIRVIKNLRVCVDCHSFAKFVSKLYARTVILRDKNRFHNIVGGVCSCGDYW